MKNANAKLRCLLLAVVIMALVSVTVPCSTLWGQSAGGESWKKETVLVSPQGDQTVVRPFEGDKILFKNADPQLAVECNDRQAAVFAHRHIRKNPNIRLFAKGGDVAVKEIRAWKMKTIYAKSPPRAAKPPKDDIYSRAAPGTYNVPPELKNFRLVSSTPMKLANAKAVGHDPGKWQSDPSRIIFHGDKYHCWMIDGYDNSIRNIPKNGKSWILYANSKDGKNWKAVDYVPLGPKGSCYDLAIEQANVLHHKGRFYLFSLGFTTNIRKYGLRRAGIFCLTADKPEGPWRQVGDVLVAPSRDGRSFDTDKVVNPRHVFFKGKWFMYYKGVKKGEPTDNGVAIADSLTGPYRKYEGNPVLFGHGHFAWRYKHGIIMVNFDAFYEKTYTRILWTEDGLHFVPLVESKGTFLFGSLYCPCDPLCGKPVTDKPTTKYWGLQSVYYRGKTGQRAQGNQDEWNARDINLKGRQHEKRKRHTEGPLTGRHDHRTGERVDLGRREEVVEGRDRADLATRRSDRGPALRGRQDPVQECRPATRRRMGTGQCAHHRRAGRPVRDVRSHRYRA